MQHNQGTNTDIAHPCVFLLNFSCSYTFLAVWRLELIVRGEDNFINLEKRFEIIEYVHVFNVYGNAFLLERSPSCYLAPLINEKVLTLNKVSIYMYVNLF